MTSSSKYPARTPRTALPRLGVLAVTGALLGSVLLIPSAQAITPVTSENGAVWQVNDSRRPGLDTGSIRNISNSRLEAFGSLFLQVDGGTDPMNGEMLRGFGLTSRGTGNYSSTASVRLDGVSVSRSLDVNTKSGTGTFFDTLTNTTTAPITVRASFGGAWGYGAPGAATSGPVSATADGDATLTANDAWAVSTPNGSQRSVGVVAGNQNSQDLTKRTVGNQQRGPFDTAYDPNSSAANYPGFVHELTLAPGATSSLLHFVQVGAVNDSAATTTTTAQLAADPDLGSLSADQICTIANWDLAQLPAFDPASCAGADPLELPVAPALAPARTSVDYDVTDKTVSELSADMAAGRVTSVEITQAYLDRIAAYDQTQMGLKSFIHVSRDALTEAAAADKARASGSTLPLLGIPIAVKDLFDVKGQPNTGGVASLKSWQPESDAFQIAALRRAGAVFLGKTNLSEFANSGSFSESGFMQSWNGLYPSKSSFGSSGGSATAVAASLAPISLGTQTGVSLYAPATGASLTTFRGTDGLTSAEGVMPLTWAQDYAGPIGQSVRDVALVLDATATRSTGNNPEDLLTSRVDSALRPTSFTEGLSADSLRGKKVGYLPASFTSTAIADDTTGPETLANARQAIEAAGGELVLLTSPAPSQPAAPGPIVGNSGAHGWNEYIASEPTFPLRTPAEVWKNLANLPYNVSGTSVDSRTSYDEVSVQNLLARRDAWKTAVEQWMVAQGVDVVAYPGFISEMGNNDASSAVLSADRATGVTTSNVGLPTVVVPIGKTSSGYSNSLQLVGAPWNDAEVLAMGYAVEQSAQARVLSTVAPALEWSGPASSVTSVSLAKTAVTAGGTTTATVRVASASATPAPGQVSVTLAGRTLTGTLRDGVATVTVPGSIGAGEYLVAARYAGSRKVAASEAATVLKVSPKATPKAARAVMKARAKGSTKLTKRLVVTVTGNGTRATGHVLLKRGTRTVASGRLVQGRVAIKVPARFAKAPRFTLRYLGSNTIKSSKLTVRGTRR